MATRGDKIRTTFTDCRRQITGSEMELIQEKLEANPGNFAMLDWAAFAYYSRGQVEVAARLYRELIARFPDNVSYHYYLAGALHKAGDDQGAAAHWRLVMDLDRAGSFAERARGRLQGPAGGSDPNRLRDLPG